MIEFSPAYVLMLFRKGLDTVSISRITGLTEPHVCRLLAAARDEELATRRTA